MRGFRLLGALCDVGNPSSLSHKLAIGTSTYLKFMAFSRLFSFLLISPFLF